MTDVEGSTRRWRESPDAMDVAMRRHHEILHKVVAAHGGWRPVDQGEGDAVFAAFRSAPAATQAAVEAQQLLQAERWPEGAHLRVRMSLHAGEVIARDGNLYGDTVNRCARIRGVAAGNQLVVSSAVYELVRDRLPDGISLQDLGEHRLKDLTRPERVYQLRGPGMAADFPPLASLDLARHNLPVQTSTFVGREAEVAEVVALLRRERLVTVTGFGGMGKTRLALQVAAEVADGDGDGVWFVDLSSVIDPDRVPAELVAVLGLTESGQGSAEAVLSHLADRRMLLVLDNLEQVIGCADFVGELHASCPDVAVLCTSREALRLRAEYEFPLAPMTVPGATQSWGENLDKLGTFEGVRLFLDRAVAVDRRFVITNDSAPAVAEIVSRLDGHPLAIELAAARLKTLSPQQLLSRLGGALTLLKGSGRDVPERHQTLQATIAWSYDLLPAPERTLLERLSVFAGAPDLDAIEVVCEGADGDEEYDVLDGVTALVEKSLLRAHEPDAEGARRFSLLRSIRDFAAAKLADRGGAGDLRQRHADYYAARAQCRLWDSLGEDLAVALVRRDVAEYRAVFDVLEQRGGEALLSFPLSFFEHLTRDGLLTECLDLGARVLVALPGVHCEKQMVMHQMAWSRERASGPDAASDLRRQMLAEAEQLGDPAHLAFALTTTVGRVRTSAQAKDLAARIETAMAPLGAAERVRDYGELVLHVSQGLRLTLQHTDPEAALQHARTLVDASDQVGGEHAQAMARRFLALSLLHVDRVDEAAQVLAQFDQTAAGPISASRRGNLLAMVAAVALRRGDRVNAEERLAEAVALGVEIGQPCWEAELLLADVEHTDSRHADAQSRVVAGLQAVAAEDLATRGRLLWRAGRANRLLGDLDGARAALVEALELLSDQEIQYLPDLLAAELERALLEGEPTEDRVAQMRGRLADGALPWGLLPV